MLPFARYLTTLLDLVVVVAVGDARTEFACSLDTVRDLSVGDLGPYRSEGGREFRAAMFTLKGGDVTVGRQRAGETANDRELETMGLVESWTEAKSGGGRALFVETAFGPEWVYEAQAAVAEEVTPVATEE